MKGFPPSYFEPNVTSPNQDGNSQTGGIDVNNPSLSHPQDALGSEPQQPSHPFLIPNHGQAKRQKTVNALTYHG